MFAEDILTMRKDTLGKTCPRFRLRFEVRRYLYAEEGAVLAQQRPVHVATCTYHMTGLSALSDQLTRRAALLYVGVKIEAAFSLD